MSIDEFCKQHDCTPTEAKELRLYLLFLRWVKQVKQLIVT